MSDNQIFTDQNRQLLTKIHF